MYSLRELGGEWDGGEHYGALKNELLKTQNANLLRYLLYDFGIETYRPDAVEWRSFVLFEDSNAVGRVALYPSVWPEDEMALGDEIRAIMLPGWLAANHARFEKLLAIGETILEQCMTEGVHTPFPYIKPAYNTAELAGVMVGGNLANFVPVRSKNGELFYFAPLGSVVDPLDKIDLNNVGHYSDCAEWKGLYFKNAGITIEEIGNGAEIILEFQDVLGKRFMLRGTSQDGTLLVTYDSRSESPESRIFMGEIRDLTGNSIQLHRVITAGSSASSALLTVGEGYKFSFTLSGASVKYLFKGALASIYCDGYKIAGKVPASCEVSESEG